MNGYWNNTRNTFGLESAIEPEDHVTSSCTCVLSFLDAPGGTLPQFLRERQSEFVSWLLSVPWVSEDLLEHNVYTAPLALSAVQRLDPEALLRPKCIEAVEFLFNELSRSDSGGVCFGEYPPSGFLTYWTVRALWEVTDLYEHKVWSDKPEEQRRTRRQIERAVAWAEQEVYRQFSYFILRDDRFDAPQMGYVLALADLAREKAKQRPDSKMISKGLEILFEAQLPNGLWPKAFPIFHYTRRGSVYPFAFETLTAVLRVCFRATDSEFDGFSVEFFRPHLKSLLHTLAWAESNELVNGRLRTQGWRSNHVLPGDAPQAWATAMVLSFVRGLHVLLRQIIRGQLLRDFNGTRLERQSDLELTEKGWTKLADSETTVTNTRAKVSIKKILFTHLLEPHLKNSGRKMWSAIFFGPPGTAKTSLARDIARTLGWPLITIETGDFLAQGADKLAHQARLIFRKLEQLLEVVILIDEVEEFVRHGCDFTLM